VSEDRKIVAAVPIMRELTKDERDLIGISVAELIPNINGYISKRSVHEFGHVILEETMGTELSVVNNARVSFNTFSQEFTDKDKGLLTFLMREFHAVPFERIELAFDIKLPIFVCRQLVKHRLSSMNEISGRYSELDYEFYIPAPDYVRKQEGKIGDYFFTPIDDVEVVEDTRYHIDRVSRECFRTYQYLLEKGVAKEVARCVLPVNLYTRIKWKLNLRVLFNFLRLRNHDHAQKEIVDYAKAIEELVTEQYPYIMKVWNEHGRNSI